MKSIKKIVAVIEPIVLVLTLCLIKIVPANALAAGSVGTWDSTAALPDHLAWSSSVEYNGYVYELAGANNSVYTNAVYYAPLNSDGTVGTWNATTALPDTLSSASTVVNNGYIYELGGFDGGQITNAVYYAAINSDGTLGAWNTTTTLPDNLDNTTTVVYNGYIYEMNGDDNSGPVSTVYYAHLNSDGSIGTWNTTTAVPDSLTRATSVVFNGFVYVLGGNDNSSLVNSVYYAPVNSDGTLGSWNSTTMLPERVSGATSVVYNGFIFEIGGGNNLSGTTDLVVSAPIDSNGTVGTWNATTSLPDVSIYPSSVIYNGFVYNLGGIDGSGLTNNVFYAPISGYPLPGIRNIASNVVSGSSITVDVLSGVSGNPDPASLTIVSGPTHGSAYDPPGTITYTPTPGYIGSDSLTYKVCSASNSGVCATASLTFNDISKVNLTSPSTGYGTTSNSDYIMLTTVIASVIFVASSLLIFYRIKSS